MAQKWHKIGQKTLFLVVNIASRAWTDSRNLNSNRANIGAFLGYEKRKMTQKWPKNGPKLAKKHFFLGVNIDFCAWTESRNLNSNRANIGAFLGYEKRKMATNSPKMAQK